MPSSLAWHSNPSPRPSLFNSFGPPFVDAVKSQYGVLFRISLCILPASEWVFKGPLLLVCSGLVCLTVQFLPSSLRVEPHFSFAPLLAKLLRLAISSVNFGSFADKTTTTTTTPTTTALWVPQSRCRTR